MAKLLCFVVLLVASAVLADAAAKAPAPAPANHVGPHPYHTYNLKVIIHNVAYRNVTFKLVIYHKDVSAPVVAKAGHWTAIGPVKVGIKVDLVEIVVAAKNNKGQEVTGAFLVKLAEFLKYVKPNSSESLVLVASEETLKGEKYLVVKINYTWALTLKL